ncbi:MULTISPECIES: bifunctional RNase H/acid phosphatase [Streptomyces]|uniref:bifunctional RNase H/acid phosphatase n=1 Tax=Streptomyces TaxID=1883 RepID=UPI0002DD0F1E|nr:MULTISPECIES: bifunctional RNase H/acid phosphatase [Streptomyces]WSI77191.1 bifunctional RNase H/acid phosphatase [Streptomyces anulatus]WTD09492.1 bifunctional RNase H/acid phosphatase [Streptomyces anulatus]WTD28403.1 bifunctional RNase H/acid phosphatase [Streptomyces anulatus]WTE02800.1 bifunctional RNase H/acid phosphatase [Streptomyces anulatus]
MSAARQVVVEADGGSRGNPGPAGYGAVVIDPATGEPLAETAEYIGVATNNVAEYRGLIAGLTAAKALFPDAGDALRVHVRMDSKLVVEQMSGRWKIKHPDMKPLAARAAAILPPSSVTYEWIPRAQNKHADRLANEAMDAGRDGRQWEASASTASLDAPARGSVSTPPPVQGPPGDQAAGAARARAALAAARGAADTLFPVPEPGVPDTTVPAAPVSAPAPGQPAGTASEKAGAPLTGWGSAPDLGAPATLVLLRHGETALTPEKRFSGSGGTDPELSATGRGQAERAAEHFAALGTVQEIVSSPLRRCRETAAAVAGRLGLDVRIDEGLRETDFGAWEGLTFGEVRERYADDLTAWLASPDTAPTGGGESFAEVAGRVAAARDRIVARYAGRTVLLVTHVTPIKTLVRLALGAPPEALFRMELSAASISTVAYYGDGNASVRLLNDTSHLR